MSAPKLSTVSKSSQRHRARRAQRRAEYANREPLPPQIPEDELEALVKDMRIAQLRHTRIQAWAAAGAGLSPAESEARQEVLARSTKHLEAAQLAAGLLPNQFHPVQPDKLRLHNPRKRHGARHNKRSV